MTQTISPAEAKALLASGREHALLDVREEGQFGEGHAFFATPCPYSVLELTVGELVPNRAVPVLLMDNGDGVAERAAAALQRLGYTDVRVVAGGAPGWAAAGYTLFKGVNVPSKALGELVEQANHPATITAETLEAWGREKRPFRLFDARPPAEYRKMCVPGAACIPNGELAHRIRAAVPDETTPVVVTCAGRTRGIIGSEGLRLAGVQNPVYALENGTQGWALAGFTLERGNQPAPYPALDAPTFADSERRAREMAAARNVPLVDEAELARLAADGGRTLYLLDVRSEAEATDDPVPGGIWAPGGQLVQATDRWVGVRHATLVLVDDTGLRATLAAVWLRQMGFDARALPLGAAPACGRAWPTLPGRPDVRLPPPPESRPAAAVAEAGWPIIDLRSSRVARQGRPAGAIWSIRPWLSALPLPAGTIALLADDAEVTALAAADLAAAGHGPIVLIEGGFAAWRDAGLPLADDTAPADEDSIDFLFFVHDRHDGNLDSSRRYLAWEQALIEQLDADERAAFRVRP